MSHPRIEEVEDSDLEASDPSEGDIDDFADHDIMRRVEPKSSASSSAAAAAAAAARATQINPSNIPAAAAPRPGAPGSEFQTTVDQKQYADFQCLYPVYFDARRTRAEGRRVPKSLAVENPIAREIVNACASLRLPTLFEPAKFHPKDWSNPGRVKIRTRFGGQQGQNGGKASASARPAGSPEIKNKHHLYILVAEHLRRNPTTEDSPALKARVQGAPAHDPSKPWPRPAVPRGWKMGELLPYISPAMTGGGVSENLFKDMMKEMQGGGDPMAALMQQAQGGALGGGGGGGGEEKAGKKKKGKGKA
ncbi:signal recognition particle subunit SRP19 [Colletotrichum orchidophilum]|uniref:Signal recognition particle subunit SRP19 n=1 Tax=Colletotrichum orchidophilum TaxID=1209926 RepID=A0A1G4BFN1_9PEZI|nr:signal recognition particle subunit SRP19 [Colletotrichum orchidophilum]OHF00310.1 signal recognition particle subunit SRP19 [Colletotrichum orchidophilum]